VETGKSLGGVGVRRDYGGRESRSIPTKSKLSVATLRMTLWRAWRAKTGRPQADWTSYVEMRAKHAAW
jgi:hypothetical protein